ncbi:MAG: TIM barrel protein [Dehalococcoidales bacterium]|nr:TIM barrel protein [Dehalococcoidales bacterium]MDZ4231058.1 TIM barrel protein [Dehalococcoidales bacterium]
MEKLLFGTGGTPHSARERSTVSGIERIAELGLGCMELEFVQGVRMGEQSARQVSEVAGREGIKLSAHAPYFINLNAREPEKIKASQQRLLQSARIASICGAESVVFHAAFYLGDSPEETYPRVKKYLQEVMAQLREENNRVWLRPEVTGKGSQFGTVTEIINLCNEVEGLAPCIDVAHCHARTGEFNSYPEFEAVLLQIKEGLVLAALDNMHIHFSGIKYGARGEIKHLDLEDSDFQYVELLQALKDQQVKGLVICESPSLESDALRLQETYDGLKKAP